MKYVDRFIRILEKAGGVDLFGEGPEGRLETVVHTGRKFDAFTLQADVGPDAVEILTESFMGVEKDCFDAVSNLLDSINYNCGGVFFISQMHRIAFTVTITMSELEELKNPFEAVFYGIEMFGKYQDAILKALLGQSVYCMQKIDV